MSRGRILFIATLPAPTSSHVDDHNLKLFLNDFHGILAKAEVAEELSNCACLLALESGLPSLNLLAELAKRFGYPYKALLLQGEQVPIAL